MSKTQDSNPEPTIWRMPDDVWAIAEEVLVREYPRHPYDRRRVDLRAVLDGVIYKLRTGCPWNQIPREFADDSTIHRAFQRWMRLGVFNQIWAMVEEGQGASGFGGTGKQDINGERRQRVS